MTLHKNITPDGWHGAKIDSGLFADRPVPSVVGQLYYVTTGTNAQKLYIALGTSSQSDWAEILDASVSSPLTVREQDNNPTVNNVVTIVVPNDRLTNNGNGQVTISIPKSIRVKTSNNAVNVLEPTELIFPNGTLTSSGDVVTVNTVSPLRIREADNNPNVSNVETIIVPNGSLTDNGNGEVSLTFPPTGVTIKEQDNNPTVNNVTSITFPNSTVTDNGSGNVTVDFPVGITVKEVDNSPNVANVSTIIVPNTSIRAQSANLVELGTGVKVTQLNNAVSVENVEVIRVPNGTLVDEGNRTVRLDIGSASATINVKESDDDPDVQNVDTLIFPDGTVTDNQDGSVTITALGGIAIEDWDQSNNTTSGITKLRFPQDDIDAIVGNTVDINPRLQIRDVSQNESSNVVKRIVVPDGSLSFPNNNDEAYLDFNPPEFPFMQFAFEVYYNNATWDNSQKKYYSHVKYNDFYIITDNGIYTTNSNNDIVLASANSPRHQIHHLNLFIEVNYYPLSPSNLNLYDPFKIAVIPLASNLYNSLPIFEAPYLYTVRGDLINQGDIGYTYTAGSASTTHVYQITYSLITGLNSSNESTFQGLHIDLFAPSQSVANDMQIYSQIKGLLYRVY